MIIYQQTQLIAEAQMMGEGMRYSLSSVDALTVPYLFRLPTGWHPFNEAILN